MAKNFKIFVSNFPPKTAYKNGEIVDVYQINRIVYTEAKAIANLSFAGELYDTATGISVGDECNGNLFGCEEQVIAPDSNNGSGERGPPGGAGPPGPPGPDGVGPPPSPPSSGGRIYCGALPGPNPPERKITLKCLKKVRGKVVSRSGLAWAQQSGNLNNFIHLFSIPQIDSDITPNDKFVVPRDGEANTILNCGFLPDMPPDVQAQTQFGDVTFDFLHTLAYKGYRPGFGGSLRSAITFESATVGKPYVQEINQESNEFNFIAPIQVPPPDPCLSPLVSDTCFSGVPTADCGCDVTGRFTPIGNVNTSNPISQNCCGNIVSVNPNCCGITDSASWINEGCQDAQFGAVDNPLYSGCIENPIYRITCNYKCKCDSGVCKSYFDGATGQRFRDFVNGTFCTASNCLTNAPHQFTIFRGCTCRMERDILPTSLNQCTSCGSLPSTTDCTTSTVSVVVDKQFDDTFLPNPDSLGEYKWRSIQDWACKVCHDENPGLNDGCGPGTRCTSTTCAQPTITNICSFNFEDGLGTVCNPAKGSTIGGGLITISGTLLRNALGPTVVKFGSNLATNVTVNLAGTELTCNLPRSTTGIGLLNVTVEVPGNGAVTRTNGFEYVRDFICCNTTSPLSPGCVANGCPSDQCIGVVGTDTPEGTQLFNTIAECQSICACPPGPPPVPAPTVTSVSPNIGPTSGNTLISITGTNFRFGTNATIVKIGGVDASLESVISSTEMEARTPSNTIGPKLVEVITNSGTGSLENGFTYTGTGPTITSVSPSCCPGTPATGPVTGNTRIVVTGTNFVTGNTTLTVGGTSVTNLTVDSSTKLTARTPPGSLGAKPVRVDTNAGNATKADGFTYIATSPDCYSSHDWTFEEYLEAFNLDTQFLTLNPALEQQCRNGVPVSGWVLDTLGTVNLVFIPTESLFCSSPGVTRLEDWWNLLKGGTYTGSTLDLKNLLVQEKFCPLITNPPRANQGNLICAGTPPHPRQFCSSLGACCPNSLRLTNCETANFVPGDKFYDIENGVVYTYKMEMVGTTIQKFWSTRGIPLRG